MLGHCDGCGKPVFKDGRYIKSGAGLWHTPCYLDRNRGSVLTDGTRLGTRDVGQHRGPPVIGDVSVYGIEEGALRITIDGRELDVDDLELYLW